MKKIYLITIFLFLFTALSSVIAVYLFSTPPVIRDKTIIYTVEPGQTLSQVAQQLEKLGVIYNAMAFKTVAQLKGMERGINAGRYNIPSNMPPIEILEMLASGKITTNYVTIPEGMTIQEAAQILQASVGIDSTTFVTLATDSKISGSLVREANTLEGYLFPATYNFYEEMSASEILNIMTNRYNNILSKERREQATKLGFSLHEIITLASIIEKEARLDSERKIISGVFHNRLRRGMLLEADPTVKFGIGRPKMRLFEKHLVDLSPYNTYVHSGLPPGPICSPGQASIDAALFPQDVPYYFFVAKGDGSHIFSITNQQHNRARIRVKRQQR